MMTSLLLPYITSSIQLYRLLTRGLCLIDEPLTTGQIYQMPVKYPSSIGQTWVKYIYVCVTKVDYAWNKD